MFVLLTEEDYVQQTMSKCYSYTYDLIICLAEEKSLIFELKKCDDILAKTVVCYSGNDLTSDQH